MQNVREFVIWNSVCFTTRSLCSLEPLRAQRDDFVDLPGDGGKSTPLVRVGRNVVNRVKISASGGPGLFLQSAVLRLEKMKKLSVLCVSVVQELGFFMLLGIGGRKEGNRENGRWRHETPDGFSL
jgi:hypothetical protein